VWYNVNYGGSVEKTMGKVSFKTFFNKPELEPPASVKPRILHFYSSPYYQTHIKECITAQWTAMLQLLDPPQEITVQNAVTKEC
jgi:hypothetical protein